MRALVFTLFILAVLWWWWGLKRASILFSVSIRDGQVAKVRGNIPPRLMAEIRDIVARAHVTQGEIKAVSRSGEPKLLFEGEMDAGMAQQMRNVVGQFTVGQIRTGQRH